MSERGETRKEEGYLVVTVTEELTVRPARPDDAERIQDVQETAHRDAGAYFGDADDGDAEALDEYRSDGDYLVAITDGRIVATGAFRPPTDLLGELVDEIPDGAVQLKRMNVLPEYQRRGYGQRIYDELERRARVQDRSEILLHTTDRQTAAQEFYEASGFAETERHSVDAFGESFESVVYRKSL